MIHEKDEEVDDRCDRCNCLITDCSFVVRGYGVYCSIECAEADKNKGENTL